MTIAWRYELARTVDVMDVQHSQTMLQHTRHDRDHRSLFYRIALPIYFLHTLILHHVVAGLGSRAVFM